MSYRACNSQRLQELVRMDPLCAVYGKAEFWQELDPKGQHLLVMELPFVNVEDTHNIMVHRVEVNAKMKGTNTPTRFTIDIPSKHWDSLTVITPA